MRTIASGLAAVIFLTAAALLTAGCGGGAGSTPQGRLLSAADLPAGWSAVPVKNKDIQTSAPCLSSLSPNPQGYTYADTAFVQGTSTPSLAEVLASGPQAQRHWQRLDSALAHCRAATITVGGEKAPVTIRPISFPRVGSWTSAYSWTFTLSGIAFGADLVLFRAGSYQGYVSYSDLGSPATATVRAFAAAAAAKAARGSTARVPDTLSIASVPVRTVATKLGTVAYRITGNGPPLVLIMGYGGSMETWDRRFVDALAKHYRVVTFDNAGVGRTRALPGTLSIDAMANQTSALIAALGLGRPDVLGWSMGTMIAQALAVLHPGQVNRLVLCADYPGNGAALVPPQQKIDALNSSDEQTVLGVLFPANQIAAGNAYLTALSSYPPEPGAPKAIVTAQANAIDAWWAGQDAAGTRTATIAAPTFIADGTADQLDPVANSRILASLIPGAKLTLFPDAGHAFLFQDEATLVPRIVSFLGG